MRLEQLIVILAGLGAIAWVLWYFLLSRRPGAAVDVASAPRGRPAVTKTVGGEDSSLTPISTLL